MSFCQIYFLREEGVPEADINVLKFVLFWAVYTILLKGDIYSLIKTELGKWNSDGYFHRACAICEKSWWNVPENLVEHQIIKNDKKIQ